MSGIQQNNRKDEKKNIKKVLSGKNAKLRGKIVKKKKCDCQKYG